MHAQLCHCSARLPSGKPEPGSLCQAKATLLTYTWQAAGLQLGSEGTASVQELQQVCYWLDIMLRRLRLLLLSYVMLGPCAALSPLGAVW